MADDKSGREKQARDADRQQRRRDVEAELERGSEPEPPVEPLDEAAFDDGLASVGFPATGAAVVAVVGDIVLETPDRSYAVEELIPATDQEYYDSPAAVENRVRRPTVALSMKRIVEASAEVSATLGTTQREAYEKTFLALVALDADDEDEGVGEVTDWILGRIRDGESLPGSRAVRRQAGKICRANGYSIRDDEWLGV